MNSGYWCSGNLWKDSELPQEVLSMMGSVWFKGEEIFWGEFMGMCLFKYSLFCDHTSFYLVLSPLLHPSSLPATWWEPPISDMLSLPRSCVSPLCPKPRSWESMDWNLWTAGQTKSIFLVVYLKYLSNSIGATKSNMNT